MSMRDESAHDGELRFVGEHPGALRVWAWRNVVIAHWYGKPTGPVAQTLWRCTDLILDQLGDGKLVSFVHLIANQLAMPDADARAVLVDSSKSHETRSALSAIVVNGSGFWASALRGVATSITILIPKTVQVRIVGGPAELVPWFPSEHERRTGVPLDPDELVSVLTKALLEAAA